MYWRGKKKTLKHSYPEAKIISIKEFKEVDKHNKTQ